MSKHLADLRKLAEAAAKHPWTSVEMCRKRASAFLAAANPEAIIALLDERDALEDMAKRALCPLGDEPDPVGDMLDEVKAERDALRDGLKAFGELFDDEDLEKKTVGKILAVRAERDALKAELEHLKGLSGHAHEKSGPTVTP